MDVLPKANIESNKRHDPGSGKGGNTTVPVVESHYMEDAIRSPKCTEEWILHTCFVLPLPGK